MKRKDEECECTSFVHGEQRRLSTMNFAPFLDSETLDLRLEEEEEEDDLVSFKTMMSSYLQLLQFGGESKNLFSW